jgi:mannose-6-phosphate isomerase-like protein (cupin superfamily)
MLTVVTDSRTAVPASICYHDVTMNYETPHYRIRRRELLAETKDLRVSILTLAAGEKIPWHHHSEVDDTFVCLDGPIRIEQRPGDGDVILNSGEKHTVPAARPHQVSGIGDSGCRFVIIQGIGSYDFVPDN